MMLPIQSGVRRIRLLKKSVCELDLAHAQCAPGEQRQIRRSFARPETDELLCDLSQQNLGVVVCAVGGPRKRRHRSHLHKDGWVGRSSCTLECRLGQFACLSGCSRLYASSGYGGLSLLQQDGIARSLEACKDAGRLR